MMSKSEQMELFLKMVESQGAARVARAIGYSDSAVSQARHGKYNGSLDQMLGRVEEVYGASTVDCPGLGEEIPLGKCAEWRRKPFAATNPLRVRMYRACKDCDRRR